MSLANPCVAMRTPQSSRIDKQPDCQLQKLNCFSRPGGPGGQIHTSSSGTSCHAAVQDAKRTAAGDVIPEKPIIRQELVGRHELVGPSIKLPDKFFKELNQKTGGQPAYVWNVDDAQALQKAIRVGAKGVISNQPLAMQAELNKLRARCSKQASVA